MKAFTLKFTTDKVNYNLIKDCVALRSKMVELEMPINHIHGHLILLFDKPTQIKFREQDAWEDLIEDMVYDSMEDGNFSDIIIKDNAIIGTITVRLM